MNFHIIKCWCPQSNFDYLVISLLCLYSCSFTNFLKLISILGLHIKNVHLCEVLLGLLVRLLFLHTILPPSKIDWYTIDRKERKGRKEGKRGSKGKCENRSQGRNEETKELRWTLGSFSSGLTLKAGQEGFKSLVFNSITSLNHFHWINPRCHMCYPIKSIVVCLHFWKSIYEVVIEGSGMFGEEQNKQVPMASF